MQTSLPIAAEAPDGTVFYAAGNLVMAVDGTNVPEVAEHVAAKVIGLGASSSALYVVTPEARISYSRSTGEQTHFWGLTGSPAFPTSAGVAVGGNGAVWVWTDWATDKSGVEYAMVYGVPAGAAKPTVLSTSAEPGSLTTDGTHGFFLQAGNSGNSLIEAAPGTQGQSIATLPAGSLGPVGLSDSQVVLYAERTTLYTYSPGGRQASVQLPSSIDGVGLAGTNSGLLFLTCTKTACSTVTRVDQSTGRTGPSVALPVSTGLVLGPEPVVLGPEPGGHLHLIRLS